MKRKIELTVSTCYECPFFKVEIMGGQGLDAVRYYCRQIGQDLKKNFAPSSEINEDCPLPLAK